jgi:hypothetical protein
MQIGVVVHDVDGRLLRCRPAAVDSRVVSDTIIMSHKVVAALFIDLVVFVHQPARPRVGTVIEQVSADVFVRGVLVRAGVFIPLVIDIEGGVRFFLGERLVEGFTRLLFRGRSAESDRGRPPVRGDDPAVQRIIPGSAVQRVGRVQNLVVLKVG